MENLGFGLYLKSLRKEKHFTLKELAEKSGTSDSYLSQVETGKRNPPKPSFLEKLSNAIGENENESKLIYTELLNKAGYIEDNNQINWKEFDSKITNAQKYEIQMFEKGFDLDVLLDEKIELRIDEKPLSKEERKALSLFIEALRELRK